MEQEKSKLAQFVVEHADDDTSKLLFAASKYPGIDIRRAATMIEARRKALSKLPSWHAHPEIDYPTSLSMEQCSSEATALYKRRFVPEGAKATADITCGLGVDSWAIAACSAAHDCCERDALLAETARGNFATLGADNITVHCTDAAAFIQEAIADGKRFDMIYADPARRGSGDRRIYSITDCEPDIASLEEQLLRLTDRLLVKVSPMADISRTLKQFPRTSELHIVAVDNECKELLMVIDRFHAGNCRIVAADIRRGGTVTFETESGEEERSTVRYADQIGRYLFIPGRAVLKSGAFKTLSARFDAAKLAPSTHLYTADTDIADFPGRRFRVVEVLPFDKKGIASFTSRYREAELLAVNFPLDTAALRKRLGTKDGGRNFVTATVIGKEKVLAVLERIA